jgi:hypothetical protein
MRRRIVMIFVLLGGGIGLGSTALLIPTGRISTSGTAKGDERRIIASEPASSCP